MRALAVTIACVLLAACGSGSDDDQRTASGQVLEGSISDAMLPLDTVTSEPPFAKVSGSPGAASTEAAEPDAEVTDDAPEGEVVPAAPATTPPSAAE